MNKLWTRRVMLALSMGLLANWAAAQDNPRVRLATSAGEIVLELYPTKAPKTVANFLEYVRNKGYDGTIFHRVMNGFMIQGGGFDPDMQERPRGAPIPLETHPELKNDRGVIAMARTSNPNSATAQFFINVVDNARLNAPNPDGYGYAAFGKVVSGMEVVDKIKTVPTGDRAGHRNVPLSPVVIQSATLVK